MSGTEQLSPRAARTRGALIAAGFDLLAVRPVDAIAIDEVVTRAGVAKGSFFNHFADKQAFATALAAEVRRELEAEVGRANAGMADPVARIAGGMRAGASFALRCPKRATVLLRSMVGVTAPAHPLNRGIADDFARAQAAGLISPEACTAGVLYWLGLCQALMASMIESGRDDDAARQRIDAMIALGLRGLGVGEAHVARIVAGSADDRRAADQNGISAPS